MSSCHLLLGRPLDLFPLLPNHSSQNPSAIQCCFSCLSALLPKTLLLYTVVSVVSLPYFPKPFCYTLLFQLSLCLTSQNPSAIHCCFSCLSALLPKTLLPYTVVSVVSLPYFPKPFCYTLLFQLSLCLTSQNPSAIHCCFSCLSALLPKTLLLYTVVSVVSLPYFPKPFCFTLLFQLSLCLTSQNPSAIHCCFSCLSALLPKTLLLYTVVSVVSLSYFPKPFCYTLLFQLSLCLTSQNPSAIHCCFSCLSALSLLPKPCSVNTFTPVLNVTTCMRGK